MKVVERGEKHPLLLRQLLENETLAQTELEEPMLTVATHHCHPIMRLHLTNNAPRQKFPCVGAVKRYPTHIGPAQVRQLVDVPILLQFPVHSP